MFLFDDKFYKSEDGRYFTREYLEHQGRIEKENDEEVWVCGMRLVKLSDGEDIRYENGTGTVVMCNYSQLFADYDNLVLCNDIVSFGDGFECMELENGNDFDEENNRYEEIFQYYIIDDGLANILKRHTDEIVYYHNGLEVYVLGVTHFGTSWDYVAAEYKM